MTVAVAVAAIVIMATVAIAVAVIVPVAIVASAAIVTMVPRISTMYFATKSPN